MARKFFKTTKPVEERYIEERPELENSPIYKWKNYSKKKNYRQIKGILSDGIKESLR